MAAPPAQPRGARARRDSRQLELGSNRNAIYKNLFDARRKLRDSLAAAGYPLTDEELSA